MRAVSLSHPKVISLLNRHFVPVYLSNEDYRDDGCAPPEERAELRRIQQEGHAAHLSVGSVHAYVVAPDGKPVDSLHTAEAAKAERLVAMLEKAVERLRPPAGAPVVKPSPRPVSQAAPGSLLLHVTARYLERRGEEYVLVQNAGGNWSALPGEDWVELTREQVAKLLPGSAGVPPASGGLKSGATWEPNREVVATILHRFYPPTENNDLAKNRLQEQTLTATVVSAGGTRVRARLEGRYRLKHPFYHTDDPFVAQGTLVGTLEFDPAAKRVVSLRLVTDEAVYGDGRQQLPFGVAVRSLP